MKLSGLESFVVEESYHRNYATFEHGVSSEPNCAVMDDDEDEEDDDDDEDDEDDWDEDEDDEEGEEDDEDDDGPEEGMQLEMFE